MRKILQRILGVGLAVAMCLGITTVMNGAPVGFIVSDAAEGYYAPITATGGNALLGQVHDLITTTHRKYTSYNDCKNPTNVKKTDPGTSSSYVMEFYSQADISASWGGGALGTWNREHVWCQSLSNGMWGQSGAGADMHHIRPVESGLNSTRGNNLFGEVSNREGNKVYYRDKSKNNVALGGYSGGGKFEPLDNVKGDVARIVMYVYTHYNTASNVYGTTNGSGGGGYFGTLHFTNIVSASNESAAIDLLLEWSRQDPVDAIETTRNEAVYKIQGNRNPFIDHPEYAEAIWGGGTVKPDPSVELKSISLNKPSLTLYTGQSETLVVTPNPANAPADVTWDSSDTAVATVSANGEVIAQSVGTATITATSTENPSIKASARVTVEKSDFKSVTITRDSFSASGSYAFHPWSAGDVGGTAFIYGGEANMMQFNSSKSSYYIASNVASSAPIKSVTVKLNPKTSSCKEWKLLTADSPYGEVSQRPENGNDHGTKTVTASGTTWTINGNDRYFALTYQSTNVCYLDSIVIEYGSQEEHTAHDGWTAWTDDGDGTHSRRTTCTSHEPVVETAVHHFAEGKCSVCGATHENHTWTNGSCSVCGIAHENHTWTNGSCSVCGIAHENHTWVNGSCSVCGIAHENHTWVNGSCSVCGVAHNHGELSVRTDDRFHWTYCDACGYRGEPVAHAWAYKDNGDGTHTHYTTCDGHAEIKEAPEEHDFENGKCTDCGAVHENHVWTNGSCTVCGVAHENHAWANGNCSVCGIAHENHAWANGNCSVCGIAHNHDKLSCGTDERNHWNYCDVCGYKSEAVAHVWAYRDNNDGTHTHFTACFGHEEIREAPETHNWEKGSCTVCGAADPGHDPHPAHDGWTEWTDNGDGTHSRRTTCTTHEPVVETAEHHFAAGKCTVCGAAHGNHAWINGNCSVCGIAHENHIWIDGRCSVCAVAHENHTWANGNCSVCGVAHGNHTWTNGSCSVCGIAHDHGELSVRTDGRSHWAYCDTCGYKGETVAHTWAYRDNDDGTHTHYTTCTVHAEISDAPEEHDFENGECILCVAPHENHTWTNGSCSVCGATHENHTWVNGSCSVCGATHENHTWTNGSCSVCGATHENHTWTNGSCSVCGVAHENHTWVNGSCSVCGIAHENHTWVNGSCSVCGVAHNHGELSVGTDDRNHWTYCDVCGYTGEAVAHTWAYRDNGDGTHTHYTTCTEHAEISNVPEEHDFENGKCTDCGAADVYRPDVDDTKLKEFHAAVEGILSSGSLQARYASISKAIVAYQALSEEEKALAEEDIAILQVAIDDYEQTIYSYNSEAKDANVAALTGLGGLFNWIIALIKFLSSLLWG